MRIAEVTEEYILFDNGDRITYDHEQDCCESNYADFEQLDDIARTTDFDTPIEFEDAEEYGFRFGNNDGRMFFVPCYSHQNWYYSNDVDIYYNGELVLNTLGEEIIL